MTAQKTYELKGDELLISIFNFFPDQEEYKFKDEGNVMLALYNQSKVEKYTGLFKNYAFDEDGLMPYSREIEDGLSILHQSSLMGKMNPTFTKYKLSPGIKIRFEKFIAPHLDDTQKELLKELANNVSHSLLD